VIFATVGTQLPFPRLLDTLDGLAETLGEEIIAQTGKDEGHWPNLDVHRLLSPAEFEAKFTAARVVVAHAGIGTILAAQRHGKPLVILPRRFERGEHRNDHQLATARQVESREGIHVAWEAEDLKELLSTPALSPASYAPSPSLEGLIGHLKGLIEG